MCNCPQPLPPPNNQIKKCRIILQILAIGLLVISILAIIAQQVLSIFMYIFSIYMLYISWSQFNWCFALVFFLFSITDFIQVTIQIVGMIEYKFFFQTDYIMISVYLIMAFFYFSIAIYFSHYAYRHFKAMNQQGLLDQMNFIPPANPGAQSDGEYYRRVQEPAIVDTRQNNYFQGQGTRIG